MPLPTSASCGLGRRNRGPAIRPEGSGRRLLVVAQARWADPAAAAPELRPNWNRAGVALDPYDDFCLTPFHPACRASGWCHLPFQVSPRSRARPSRASGLALNVETYQASIEGRPLDLTYRNTNC